MAREEVRLEGLKGVLATLKSLPPELVSKNGGPVRAALRKAAKPMEARAKTNFRAAVDSPGKSGITDSTGFTEKQITTKRGRLLNGEKGEAVYITVRSVDHPSGKSFVRKSRSAKKRRLRLRKRTTIKSNDIAFIMEYGSERQPATPWLRPAFEATKNESLDIFVREINAGIAKIVKKLEQQNQGKS